MDKQIFEKYLQDIKDELEAREYRGFWNKRWLAGAMAVLDMLIDDIQEGKFDPPENRHSLYHEIFNYVLQGRKRNPTRINPETDPTIIEVVGAVQNVWPDKAAREWLFGNNDYLDGARPIDFLIFGKTLEVMNALELEKA